MNDAYAVIVRWWRERKIQTEAALSEILNGTGVLFAYHSGRLENERVTWNDTRDIFDRDGVTNYTGDLRTLFEIRNAKSAYEYFLTAFGERRPLDEAFLLRLQKLLTRNTYDARRYALGERPGTWKKHDFVTGRHEIGAAPGDTAEKVAELLDELRQIPPSFPPSATPEKIQLEQLRGLCRPPERGEMSRSDRGGENSPPPGATRHPPPKGEGLDAQTLPPEKILTAAAYFHAKLENIHPFADGNGRTGRLAMNYFLVTRNHPPIVVHEDERAAYYAALEAWDIAQSLTPMRDFLTAQSVRTWAARVTASGNGDSPRLNDFL